MSWDELVGTTVSGKYQLLQLIGSTSRSAVYLISYGPEGGRAAFKLAFIDEMPVEVPAVSHPHIISLFLSGVCRVGKRHYRYFVTELAEAPLATAIAARALSPDEAVEMLGPVLQAMVFLHGQGLAHGRIVPANILRVGDSFKLSVDSVRPEGPVFSAAKDMRAFGLTVIEALTQLRQESLVASLPQPFRDIAEGSLDGDPGHQWTARVAAAKLSGEMPVPVPQLPVLEPQSEEVPTPAPPPPVAPAEDKPRRATAREIAVYAATVLLLLVAFVFVRASGTGSPVHATAAPHEPVPPTTPTATTPVPTPVVRTASKVKSDEWWCVVVGSFSSQTNALHQADSIAHKWPEFHPRVLPPAGNNPYYLVSIGAGLSAETAKWWRERAVAAGISGDTYVRFYPPE